MVGSIVGFVASLIALRWFHYDLLGLAAVGLSVTNAVALFVAVDTCRRLSIPVRPYFARRTGDRWRARRCSAPVSSRSISSSTAARLSTLVASALLGVFMLVPLYWRIVPREMRDTVVRSVTTRLAAWRLGFQVP